MIPKRCGSNKRRKAPGEDVKPKCKSRAKPLHGGREVRADEIAKATTEALKKRGVYGKGLRDSGPRRNVPRGRMAHTEGHETEGGIE